ncbi:GAF sensor signal transduction histidine kinase [Loktanella fryxellensis]|uniref:histidine kinase n=1 Tax=Loktanella fryxellensis TaxID=245187 RepID=A0A1H8HA23_9RHOB|nr:GAF domain-containing sensor histidine kinase [Loktanella fryxellensis]SEN53005.1 GAF sensor signal transduction histidine kinase [Loktanella fryxellensis]
MTTPEVPPIPRDTHDAYLAGAHNFQRDIAAVANSPMIDTILRTIMLATQMRFAAVARVTQDRWVACQTIDDIDFGLQAGDEIAITSTFCQTVRDTAQPVVFDDAATDPIYAGNSIAAMFGIASYASIPIRRPDGSFFGTLCAIDTAPRSVTDPNAMAMLTMFADIIGQGLEVEEQLAIQIGRTQAGQELLAVQERFVAVLSHDLRNPVAALQAGLRQLDREPLGERGRIVMPLMRATLQRTHELIENMIMHARSRIVGGIRIGIVPHAPLAQTLSQVADEFNMTAPDHRLLVAVDFDGPVACDAARIGQAVSNLLSNAVTYGTPDTPIHLIGRATDAVVEIAVTNAGPPIPPDVQATMFMPFQQGQGHMTDSNGLGLGLFIAASIAKAHGGTIAAASGDGLTTFTIRLPVGAAGAAG